MLSLTTNSAPDGIIVRLVSPNACGARGTWTRTERRVRHPQTTRPSVLLLAMCVCRHVSAQHAQFQRKLEKTEEPPPVNHRTTYSRFNMRTYLVCQKSKKKRFIV